MTEHKKENQLSPQNKAWEEVRQGVEACVSCGACLAVCPTYQAGRKEAFSSRGKLRLLRGLDEDGLEASRDLLESLGSCLLCGRCSEECPNQVPGMQTIRKGRELMAGLCGPPPIKRLALEHGLGDEANFKAAMRAARLAHPLSKLAAPLTSGLHLRLPGLEGIGHLPSPAAKPFDRQVPRVIEGPKGAPRLGLFLGCVTNYMRPELARAMVEILSKRYTLVIPPGQGCCGLPAVSAGMADLAGKLALANLEAFKDAQVDRIVTACGSCAFTLIEEAPRLLGGQHQEAARQMAEKVVEVSQVAVEMDLEPRLASQGPVTVHDPCHLGVGLGVTQEPRDMLTKAGVEVVTMDGQDRCCGGGGLFSVTEPELSQEIFAPRREALQKSGAEVLATSCSGCFIQWRRGLDPKTPVLHPLEMVRAKE